jgi:hypothetical protein
MLKKLSLLLVLLISLTSCSKFEGSYFGDIGGTLGNIAISKNSNGLYNISLDFDYKRRSYFFKGEKDGNTLRINDILNNEKEHTVQGTLTISDFGNKLSGNFIVNFYGTNTQNFTVTCKKE